MSHDWEHANRFTPVLTSNSGSELRRDWSLMPWNGLTEVLAAFEEGRKYDRDGVKGWTLDAPQDSLLHLAEHTIAALNTSGEVQKEHVVHAVARGLMVLEQMYREQNNV